MLNKRKIVLSVCLVIAWTLSYGQKYLINGDSLYCYTDQEIRQIAIKLVERTGCLDELQATEQQVEACQSMVSNYQGIESALRADIEIKTHIIDLHVQQDRAYEDQIKAWRRKYNRTVIGGGVALLGLIVLGVMR